MNSSQSKNHIQNTAMPVCPVLSLRGPSVSSWRLKENSPTNWLLKWMWTGWYLWSPRIQSDMIKAITNKRRKNNIMAISCWQNENAHPAVSLSCFCTLSSARDDNDASSSVCLWCSRGGRPNLQTWATPAEEELNQRGRAASAVPTFLWMMRV